jgi:hypothetical protein
VPPPKKMIQRLAAGQFGLARHVGQQAAPATESWSI